jgi:threonine-phosphate decarboxylase
MKKLDGWAADPAVLFQHGGGASNFASALDFSININPLGPPDSVRWAILSALPCVVEYPDAYSQAFRRLLAEAHRIDAAQFAAGNGSNDLIYALARALKPRRAAIVEPTYTEYLRAMQRVETAVDHWIALEPTCDPEPFDPGLADIVWLGHPNNPTGRPWQPRILADWIAAFPRTRFVVDEAFLPFVPEEDKHSLIPWLAQLPNVLVLRSLTKVYSIPGLRLGYMAASTELAERVRSEIVPWSVNTLAQHAGMAALADRQFLADTHAWLATQRAWLSRELASLEAVHSVVPSGANFLLLRLRKPRASWLAERMAWHGIRIRVASNFIGLDDSYLRVAVRTAAENEQLIGRMRDVLEERPR